MTKMTIKVEDFVPRRNNTLHGFCALKIAELHLTINDISIHAKNGRRWVSLPMRPWVKDGQVVTGDDGKPKYFPVLEFDSNEAREGFSAAAIRALLEAFPRAFDTEAAS